MQKAIRQPVKVWDLPARLSRWRLVPHFGCASNLIDGETRMKKTAIALGLIAALALPPTAEAKIVTVLTTLKPYRGDRAYLAIYLTDALGRFHSTLYLAGRKAKYRKHLRGWARANRSRRGRRFDGITGASVGSGRTLQVSVDIADALIDAGFQIRVDSSVEDRRDVVADVVAPLDQSAIGVPIRGRGFVEALSFAM